MVTAVKQFFTKYINPNPETTAGVSDHSLQIATAALLIEMMRADTHISDDEKSTIRKSMKSKFDLSGEEVDALIHLAEEKIWEATGYFEFTSLMNKGFSQQQKIKVIEHLWEVAYADSILDKHEEYMVRKIADLIYVSHKDFIEAKLRVKKQIQM